MTAGVGARHAESGHPTLLSVCLSTSAACPPVCLSHAAAVIVTFTVTQCCKFPPCPIWVEQINLGKFFFLFVPGSVAYKLPFIYDSGVLSPFCKRGALFAHLGLRMLSVFHLLFGKMAIVSHCSYRECHETVDYSETA